MSAAPKRSHKKKLSNERQTKAASNFGNQFAPPKRSHKKKGSAAYNREQKRIANLGVLYIPAAPKRSHKKKAPSSTLQITLGTVNLSYPRTATTFWKQMEPGIHAVMQGALKQASVGSEDIRGITRRIYRAAVLSAAAFLKKESPALPSEKFLREQSNKAVDKAIRKLFNSYPSVY